MNSRVEEISNKLAMRVLVASYEYYLGAGEQEYLKSVSTLGSEIEENYPLLFKKLSENVFIQNER